MTLYSKESLDALRHRIDLAEVVSSYVKMQRSGSSYKGLCPFHEEKTPSFMIHKGDTHYHCFGCGAHGDAISFLMNHVKMTFVDALESLAERFQVPLQKVEEEEKGPNKGRLKQALQRANAYYHFFLLHSGEGEKALQYLYARGIDLAFLQRFEIGYAPKQGQMISRLLLEEGFSEEELSLAGLMRIAQTGGTYDFFSERITFPIRDRVGAVIGFSARKFREEVFGGKYINTPETPLFKKSQVLFGLCYSRHRIAKERKALVVEGQIDALRLIDSGFDFTVAGQGTAFGEGHVKELLQLGVAHVLLALDADLAGQEACVKIGELFQRKGVEVTCVLLPKASDPDSYLRQYGSSAFAALLEKGVDYLSFYYRHLCQGQDLSSPAKKSEIVNKIAERVRQWEHPVLVHESFKKLSEMSGIPKEILGVETLLMVRQARPRLSTSVEIDPDLVLEMDLLRWLYLPQEAEGQKVLSWVQINLDPSHFKIEACRSLFLSYLALSSEQRRDSLCLAEQLQTVEQRQILSSLPLKKVNLQRAEEGVKETLQQLLFRDWMERGEKLQQRIQNPATSEEEITDLMKEMAELKKQSPKLRSP